METPHRSAPVGKLPRVFLLESGVLTKAEAKAVVVAEWLRRWTRNPLGFPRAGSNPANNVQVI